MMRNGNSSKKVSKRLLQDDCESENSPKKNCLDPEIMHVDRRIRDVVSERHAKSMESNNNFAESLENSSNGESSME